MRQYIKLWTFSFIFIGVAGCATDRARVSLDRPFQAECLKELVMMNEINYEISEENEETESWKLEISDQRIFLMAKVLGISGTMHRYIKEINKESPDEDFLNQEGRKIERAIQMASFEISAITGGIDCEEEKAEQIATFLDKRVKNKETNRTVAAIVTGAAISTGTGVALVAGASGALLEVLGIVGGLAEVWLGVSILRLEKYVEIEHPFNVIDMIYLKDNSDRVFPESVWAYINIDVNDDSVSKRDRLVDRWEDFEVDVSSLEILRSKGGKYDSELLKTRANMLDQLEAQIYLMKQDLMLFTKFFYSLH